MKNTILYNPDCSKSRELLSIVRTVGVKFRLRNYLTHPLTEEEILYLLSMLELENPESLMRQSFNDEPTNVSQSIKHKRIAEALAAAPDLLQRPVVIIKGKAIIARPPSLAIKFIEKSSSS
tara:strand:- start:2156 stop:2518 length:363 start_codon:yes stop_codon:yes gene_type:complete